MVDLEVIQDQTQMQLTRQTCHNLSSSPKDPWQHRLSPIKQSLTKTIGCKAVVNPEATTKVMDLYKMQFLKIKLISFSKIMSKWFAKKNSHRARIWLSRSAMQSVSITTWATIQIKSHCRTSKYILSIFLMFSFFFTAKWTEMEDHNPILEKTESTNNKSTWIYLSRNSSPISKAI